MKNETESSRMKIDAMKILQECDEKKLKEKDEKIKQVIKDSEE